MTLVFTQRTLINARRVRRRLAAPSDHSEWRWLNSTKWSCVTLETKIALSCYKAMKWWCGPLHHKLFEPLLGDATVHQCTFATSYTKSHEQLQQIWHRVGDLLRKVNEVTQTRSHIKAYFTNELTRCSSCELIFPMSCQSPESAIPRTCGKVCL